MRSAQRVDLAPEAGLILSRSEILEIRQQLHRLIIAFRLPDRDNFPLSSTAWVPCRSVDRGASPSHAQLRARGGPSLGRPSLRRSAGVRRPSVRRREEASQVSAAQPLGLRGRSDNRHASSCATHGHPPKTRWSSRLNPGCAAPWRVRVPPRPPVPHVQAR